MCMAASPVSIQALSRSEPSTPSWFGEVVLLTAYLRKHQVLAKISERVRFRRRRFGHYEVLDFLAVLFGYARSLERTLEANYLAALSLCHSLHGPLALFGGVD